MAILGPSDALPPAPSRILIGGTSGSGKTTLARRISAIIDIPYTEIDGLHHGPHWIPRAEFAADVGNVATRERWITEYQYPAARPCASAVGRI